MASLSPVASASNSGVVDTGIARFRNEISYGLHANHRNVVKIHSHSEDDESFYYVMDLYSMTLREVIKAESDYKALLDYLLQLCDGLAHVHREGVVHRDIKPENVLVDIEKRQLVLADFGIARFKNSSLTKRGQLLANRNYLAPEQMARRDPDSVGKPSDVFALGLIATEMFTKHNSRGGRHPLVRDTYPFLSDVDLLAERMMLQDETRRIGIEAVRDSLLRISRQVGSMIDDIAEELRPGEPLTVGAPAEVGLTLERAARDVLWVCCTDR